MDSKEYIASGAIEAYVLGLAAPDEMARAEMLRAQYPEIDRAIKEFETQLESKLQATSIPAPSSIKNELIAKLQPEFRKEAILRSIPPAAISRPVWKWVAAASIILLIGSAAFNYYLFNKNREAENSYARVTKEVNDLKAENQLFSAKIEEMHKGMTMMSDPMVAKVSLPGMGTHTQNKAMVLWDTKTKDVYLMPMDLPVAPNGKQYQLWALVDGKPVDAGMLDNCTVLCTMKNISIAEAFAITLEKQGGSPAPDLDQLYVMGKVSP